MTTVVATMDSHLSGTTTPRSTGTTTPRSTGTNGLEWNDGPSDESVAGYRNDGQPLFRTPGGMDAALAALNGPPGLQGCGRQWQAARTARPCQSATVAASTSMTVACKLTQKSSLADDLGANTSLGGSGVVEVEGGDHGWP